MTISTLIPSNRPLSGLITLPGCKSHTNRALLCAAAASGISHLRGVSLSEDSLRMLRLLESCGVAIKRVQGNVEISGLGCGPRLAGQALDLGDTGTALRFLLPFAAAGEGSSRWTGTDRMKQRPLRPLLAALEKLGARFRFLEKEGALPFVLEANGLRGEEIAIETNESSQFLSGLLLASPLASQSLRVRLAGDRVVSSPYIEMTRTMQSSFGVDSQSLPNGFATQGRYRAAEIQIPGDASAAFWFLTAVALAGGEIGIQNLVYDELGATLGGLALGEELGFEAQWSGKELCVRRATGRPFRRDFSAIPDLVPAAAVAALFLPGTSEIHGAAHLRGKESDRLDALTRELSRCGARIHPLDDGLRIDGGVPLRPARLDAHADHRLVAAFSLLQLRVPGIEISDPSSIAKSYPAFFQDFQGLFRDNPTP